MDKYLIREDAAYVSPDGNYGQGIIVFDPTLLNNNQWEMLTDMADRDRFDYVKAIADKNNVAVCEIEMENFGEEFGLED
jgi:hypothetical protein